MIRSFKCAETARIWAGEVSPTFPPDIQEAVRRRLRAVAAAVTITDLRVPPGNRLEKLTGNRAGQYSVRVNEQWRICFIWDEGNADAVEIVDYH